MHPSDARTHAENEANETGVDAADGDICCACRRLRHAAITKVEPPDWPAEPGTTTLRILLTGSESGRSAVHAPFPPGAVAVSADGTHLFLIPIFPRTRLPAAIHFKSVTAKPNANARFTIVPRTSVRAAAFRDSLPTM